MAKFEGTIYKNLNLGSGNETRTNKDTIFESESLGELVNEFMKMANEKCWKFNSLRITFDRGLFDTDTKTWDNLSFFINSEES